MPPNSHLDPPECIFCSPVPCLTEGRRSEFGGIGGARGHIVGPAKVSQIDTVFTKTLSKTAKRGYPLFLPGFWEACGHFGPPPLVCALGSRFCPEGSTPPGQKPHFGPQYRGGGPKCPQASQNRVFRRGAHLAPPIVPACVALSLHGKARWFMV